MFTSDAPHNLVTWVGSHIEQLANWSCDQVRAGIVKRSESSRSISTAPSEVVAQATESADLSST